MTESYEPELGQAIFGCPTGEYELPQYVMAFLSAILDEIDRVFWNVNQREWDRLEDPKIPNIIYHPYYWGDNEKLEERPNFVFEKVEIRWYKHPGRGTTCDVDWGCGAWVEWFIQCMKSIHTYEKTLDEE